MPAGERLSLVGEAIANREGRPLVTKETGTPAKGRDIYPLHNAFDVFTYVHTPEFDRLGLREYSVLHAPDIDTINAVVTGGKGEKVKVSIVTEQSSFLFPSFEIKVEDIPEVFVIKTIDVGVVETRRVTAPSSVFHKERSEVVSSRPFEIDDVANLSELLEQLEEPTAEIRFWRLRGENYVKTFSGGFVSPSVARTFPGDL